MSKKIMTEDTMQASAETTAIATKNNHEEKFKEDVIEAIQERVDKNVETIASQQSKLLIKEIQNWLKSHFVWTETTGLNLQTKRLNRNWLSLFP